MIKKLAEGERLFQAGDKQGAEALFKEALEAEPGQVRALNNLAVMALADRRLGEAEGFIDLALAVDPRDPGALRNRLNLALLRGWWAVAAAAAETILAQTPDDVKIIKIAAGAAARLEKPLEALTLAERLLSLRPGDVEALELAAAARLKADDRDGAGEALKAALTLAPERTDLAVRLALLNRPDVSGERDLWPDPVSAGSPLALAGVYRRTWAGVNSSDPVVKAAGILARLDDPGRLTDEDLPENPPSPPDYSYIREKPEAAADVAGLSVMFAPTVIAGQSAMMARWLKARRVRAVNVEISKNYLGYGADYYYPDSQAEIPGFIDLMMKKAESFDVLCLDFGSSLHYLPNLSSRLDYRREKVPGQPYADLRRLKDKGVKIFFHFWGSDFLNQSLGPYLYLKYLGFEDLPRPPFQTKFQHLNVMAADELADALLGVDFDLSVLPRIAPYADTYFEPERWPMKTGYRPRVEKILTAPTNPRKKNYTLIRSALSSFLSRHPEASAFRVRNKPHAQVPPLYAQADVGIDQATFGFGTFSVEMMALGLPVICARPPSHSQRDAAPVLSFNNIRELAARLEECARNPEMLPELGRRGREYVMEHHDINVGGRIFSHYLAEAAAGGRVPQIVRPGYERASRIWSRDPESVYAFRFYDAAVPLFCALGEPEYAAVLCLDAMDCDYRDRKFMTWLKAICDAGKFQMAAYKPVPDAEVLRRDAARIMPVLKDSKALLEEYAAQLAEAEKIRGAEDGAP